MKIFQFLSIFAVCEGKQIWSWGKKCFEATVIEDFDIER